MNRFGPSRTCECGRELDGGEMCPDCDRDEINRLLEQMEEERREVHEA